jgi:tRNA (cytidine32/uridine32-2'-O)-methyltransferase
MDIPVKIVLVETSHPGNIGAVARAMKTMGLRELALVKPKVFPSPEATARASGADDLLERALVHDSLAAAIGDCGFVVGTSARLRSLPCPTLTPRECAARVCEHSSHTKVAIVMGPEKSGLTNEHMSMCRYLVHIPTHPDYGSLNLAMATQVICYELRMMALGEAARVPYERDAPLATASEVEGFQAHLERVLTEAKFLSPEHPTQLKLKLRRLFQRAELDRNEVNILRGVLAALEPSKKLPNE